MVNVYDINSRRDLSRRDRLILNCGWLICGGWIDELCWRLDKEIKVKDILKEKEKEEMKKDLNAATMAMNYGEEPVDRHDSFTNAVYEKKEREALMERIKAMDDKQLAIVAECIPVEICMARIQKEYQQLKALRDSIQNAIGNV